MRPVWRCSALELFPWGVHADWEIPAGLLVRPLRGQRVVGFFSMAAARGGCEVRPLRLRQNADGRFCGTLNRCLRRCHGIHGPG